MYPHAKGGLYGGMWITLLPHPSCVDMWITWNLYVNKVVWYCQSVMLDGRDDGIAVKVPIPNVLL